MKLTLAYCPIACSLVPYILLLEAGADFDVLPVNLGKGENFSPEYLRVNPKGKVPALIIDGQVLTENCLLYTSPSPRDGLLSRMPSSA